MPRLASCQSKELITATEIENQENICQLVDAFEDPQHICLVLEYVDGGDLLDYIMNSNNPAGGGLCE